jgi:hypothetical protein
MIRDFICILEDKFGTEIWRHYCKIRNAKNSKEFWDGLKGIAKVIDELL